MPQEKHEMEPHERICDEIERVGNAVYDMHGSLINIGEQTSAISNHAAGDAVWGELKERDGSRVFIRCRRVAAVYATHDGETEQTVLVVGGDTITVDVPLKTVMLELFGRDIDKPIGLMDQFSR